MQRINLQPGYVLHQRPYRDTSAIIEVLTPEFGRMSLLGKGVKRPKSRFQGQLRAFQPMLISWCGRGELMTLTQVEIPGKHLQMNGSCLSSGFYLNELLMRLAHKFEPQIEIFNDYDTAVRGLSDLQGTSGRDRQLLQAILRIFEIKLLRNLGYEILLDTEAETHTTVQVEAEYQYHLDHGPVRINSSAENSNNREADYDSELITVSGETLLVLSNFDELLELADAKIFKEAKQLMRVILARHLGDKPLVSRELFLPK